MFKTPISEPFYQSKPFLRFFVILPCLILYSIILFIYVTYNSFYTIPLLLQTYWYDNNPNSLITSQEFPIFHEIHRIEDAFFALFSRFSQISLGFSQFPQEDHYKRGLILTIILNYLMFWLVFSIIRTMRTDAGKSPNSESIWTLKIENMVSLYHEKEKEIVRKYVRLEKTMNDQQKNRIYSEGNDMAIGRSLSVPDKMIYEENHDILEDEKQESSVKQGVQGSHSEKSWFFLNSDYDEKSEKSEKSERSEKKEKSEKNGNFEKSEKSEKIEKNAKNEKNEKNAKSENIEKNEKNAKNVKNAKSETNEKSEKSIEFSEKDLEKINETALGRVMKWGIFRFCRHCKSFKPLRTHHCRQCMRCVLKMDHHCQWVLNCVGLSNYKYFMNVLIYANFSLLFVLTTFSRCVMDVALNPYIDGLTIYCVLLCFVLGIVMFFIVFGFCGFHFWLIFKGRTTLEFCEKEKKEKKMKGNDADFHEDFGADYKEICYSLGPWQNFTKVFGRNPLLWFFPFRSGEEESGLFEEYEDVYIKEMEEH